MGYSNATWEGDTLVIEAVGLQQGLPAAAGVPHSDQLKVIEKRTMLEDSNTKLLKRSLMTQFFTEAVGVLPSGSGLTLK